MPAILTAFPATHACSDAASGQLGYRDPLVLPSPGRELVVLCQDGGSTLYRVRRGPDGLDIEPLVHASATLTAIRVGDVTGDGVADVVGLEGVVGARSLVVYPQCSSRELERCRAAPATRGGS